MWRSLARAAVLGAWLSTGCPPAPKPDPAPKPTPAADGCDAACRNLDRLNCPDRNARGRDDIAGTADDVPCAQACRDVEATGIVEMNTQCVAAAPSCSEARSCN